MGIHVVHFLHQGIKKWGIVNENLVRPIEKDFDTLASLLAEGIDKIKGLADHQKDISLDEVTLLSPVTNRHVSFAKEQTMEVIEQKVV